MKITCQSCQAKYTIADEKVAGKTVKIKCKKCGATIVVNGADAGAQGPIAAPPPAAAAPPPAEEDEEGGATRVFAEGSGPGTEWTVNVTDDDQRTMTSAQIAVEYQRGIVNDDTYVWKDGMADWSPVSNVPELMQLINAAPAPRPAAGRPVAAPEPAMPPGGFGGTMMMNEPAPASPFAAVAAQPAATPAPAAARRKAPAGGVDLFGQHTEAQTSSASSASSASADRLVGERNENSVLFSISALTAAAGASKKNDDPFDLGAAPAARNGGRGGGGSVDDIMNLGGGMPAGPVLAPPPLLAPVVEAPPPPAPMPAMPSMGMGMGMGIGAAEYPPQKKKAPIGLIVGLVVGVLGLGGGAFVALNSGGAAKDAGGEAAKSTATATATSAPAATTAAPDDTQAPTANTAAAAPTTTDAPVAATNAPSTAAGNPGKPAETRPGGRPVETKPAESKPDKPVEAKADKPVEAKADKPAADKADKPAADTGSGKEFDRGAAMSALNGAAGGARSCKTADGPTGSGKVRVTFAPSGHVTSATLESGPWAGTPMAGCIIGAFRGAHIPPFDGAPQPVSKTITIN